MARVPQQQVPGHPQVQGQGPAALEPEQQVLAAPRDRSHLPARHGPLDRLRRLRPRQPLVEHLGRHDPLPDELRLELATDRLHLG